MKTTIKVFIILGMIFAFYLIFPIVVGIFALKALNEARNAKDLTTMGVLTLIFCNAIAGILMLLIKDEDLLSNECESIEDRKVSDDSVYQSLIQLKKLFDDHIITEEEFEQKKQYYLSVF